MSVYIYVANPLRWVGSIQSCASYRAAQRRSVSEACAEHAESTTINPQMSTQCESMRPRHLSWVADYAGRKWLDCRRARSLRSRSHDKAKRRMR